MLYFDTSFIAPLFFPEKTSDAIEKFIHTLDYSEFSISHWTRTEFASLTARLVRMKNINETLAEKTLAVFENFISQSFNIIIPTVNDFNLAIEFIQKYKTQLRAGDALHLAIAKNRQAKNVYTLDEKLLSAAKQLNICATGI